MKKIVTLLKNINHFENLKPYANPGILDDYFYIHKRTKHHLCLFKEYFNDDVLFERIISGYEIIEQPPEILRERGNNTPCLGCDLSCVNRVHHMFNFATYFIFINIQNNSNLVCDIERKDLILDCLNLFSENKGKLNYDFERMAIYFADYNISKQEHILSKNDTLHNIEYLNDYEDLVNKTLNRISSIVDEKIRIYKPTKKFIKNKIKYYDKKLIIEEKFQELEKSELKVPFEFQNNFDKVNEKKVYKHFFDNLVKKGYLSKEDLEKYLLLAFQDKKVPEEKFKISGPKVGFITNIFYEYYCDISSKRHGRKMDYAELLGLYFKGFEAEKVVNNFARNYIKVRK